MNHFGKIAPAAPDHDIAPVVAPAACDLAACGIVTAAEHPGTRA
jgi:hypothetical protein